MARTRSPLPLPKDQQKTQWYRMEADQENDTAEIFVYDAIGGWFGVKASEFVKDLSEITASKIIVRVNSPGGDVYDGVAIMNALKRHPATITVTVDGLAASAASFLIQAADDIQMGKGSELMIHDASTFMWGDAAFARETADFLDRISNTIAAVYADRAGGTAQEWRDRMISETWYTAEEAVAAGLADSVIGSEATQKESEDLKNRMDLSVFAYAGRRAAPQPAPTNATPPRRDIQPHLTAALAVAQEWENTIAESESLAQPITMEGNEMSDALTQGLAKRLGINLKAGEAVDDSTLLSALDEALDEQEAPVAAAAVAQVPGTVVMDAAQHQQLVNDAAAGRAARDQQVTEHRVKVVENAIDTGRIPPARRESWLNQLAADPGAEQILNSLAPGLIPLEAKGFTGGVDEASDEDRTYNKLYPKES